MHEFGSSVPLFSTRIRGMRIVVTLQLVANVLRVPRVEHLDYPRYERLRAVSKDEMISTFCKRPSDVADVLRVLRVEHPDYPGCDHLKTVSKDGV